MVACHVATLRGKYGQKSHDSSLSRPKVVPFNLDQASLVWLGHSECHDNWKSVCLYFVVRGVHVEHQSSPFHCVHFVASQRLDTQISTMGIIPPSLCWSFHWLRENCTLCKAMWVESVSGKLAEQIIHRLRPRTKTRRQIFKGSVEQNKKEKKWPVDIL